MNTVQSSAIERGERRSRRFKQVKEEIRKLRSKSCGRLFSEQKVDETVTNIPETNITKNDIVDEKSRSELSGPYQGWARALVDYVPSPYDKVALAFKAGEYIHLLEKGEGGLWWGECGGRRGAFKCVSVEIVKGSPVNNENRTEKETSCNSTRSLLSSIGLSTLASKLELNGFDSLEMFKNISYDDMKFLEIEDKEVQVKIITAATVLSWMSCSGKLFCTIELNIHCNFLQKFHIN